MFHTPFNHHNHELSLYIQIGTHSCSSQYHTAHDHTLPLITIARNSNLMGISSKYTQHVCNISSIICIMLKQWLCITGSALHVGQVGVILVHIGVSQQQNHAIAFPTIKEYVYNTAQSCLCI